MSDHVEAPPQENDTINEQMFETANYEVCDLFFSPFNIFQDLLFKNMSVSRLAFIDLIIKGCWFISVGFGIVSHDICKEGSLFDN